jgi:hypothetical protein
VVTFLLDKPTRLVRKEQVDKPVLLPFPGPAGPGEPKFTDPKDGCAYLIMVRISHRGSQFSLDLAKQIVRAPGKA